MAEMRGLSSEEAFKILAADMDQVLQKHCAKTRSRWRTLRLTLFDAVTWNRRSLAFTSLFLIFVLLGIIYERRPSDMCMFLLIFGVAVFNTVLVCKVRWMRWTLCKHRVEHIRKVIDELIEAGDPWNNERAYPSLFQPTSPSVHLQWVFRDARLVNLPACLLVRGDLILLRPGQEIFTECRAAKSAEGCASSPEHLSPGQVYQPELEAKMPPPGVTAAVQHNIQLPRNFEGFLPRRRQQGPLCQQHYQVTKTPFVDSLELLLVRAAEEETVPWRSIPELKVAKLIDLVHLLTGLLFLLGLIEAIALRVANPEGAGPMSEVFLRPVYVSYCAFPLLCPLLWFLYRAWVAAQFRLYSDSSVFPKDESLATLGGQDIGTCEMDSSDSSLSGSDRTSLLQRPKDRKEVTAGQQFREMLKVLRCWDAGASEVVFNLGTLTALCCVDKKGVLSLSQPTVDKVFFLRRRHHRHGSILAAVGPTGSLRQATRRRSEVSMASSVRKDEQSTIGSHCSGRFRLRAALSESQPAPPQSAFTTASQDFHAHVLEVSNLRSRPYEQSFQERHWHRYLNSLKPIGLNILLNNCNADMFPRYTALADYLTLLADRSPDGREVAAINHRCMCGLARQIGFVDSATQPFQLATSLAAFRHAGANAAGAALGRHSETGGAEGTEAGRSQLQERLFRALSSSRHRTPMAHVLSAVTTQARVGCLQLMSQGSADLLLDLCVDYWDGYNLNPLRDAEKRRALDFYHRHIHSAYCTAFAYSPLFESIAESLADVVLELPSQGAALTAHIPRRALPGVQTINEMTSVSPPVGVGAADGSLASRLITPAVPAAGRASLTTEAMLSPVAMAEITRNRSMSAESMLSRLSTESISTSEECMELLRNQVFLGMASLQYQPLADVVPMVKNLQEACIRFVHFSQENELRSRVFAEKLGLEAGSFNCHISLAENGGHAQANIPNDASAQRCSQAAPDGNTNILSRWDSAPVVMGNVVVTVGTANNCNDSKKSPKSPYDGPAANAEDDEPLSFVPRPRKHQEEEEEEEEEEEDDEEEEDLKGNISTGSGSSIESSSTSESGDSDEVDSITQHLRQDKSQMPRGISAIRPHLSSVDNIPLQVSLFTDCAPDAVREMLEIMQENGEIVTVVGSTLSLHNTAIFLQADCSVGLRPDIPYMCIGQAPSSNTAEPAMLRSEICSPTDLASAFLSLACSMSGFRARGFRHLAPNVAEARALVKRLRLTMSFHFLACLFIALFELLAVAVGWPNGPGGDGAFDFFLFEAGCLMVLQLLTVPALSIPILLCPREVARIMKAPPTKRDPQRVRKFLTRLVLYGCARFLPSLLALLLLAHCSILSICSRADVECVLRLPNATEGLTKNATVVFTNAQMQRSAGQFSYVFAVCFLVAISLSYMADERRLWKIRAPTLKLWATFSVVHICLAFLAIVPLNYATFSWIHPGVYVAGVVWTFALFPLNEFVNYKENSINLREERRARFMFNTKLGMYSPV